MLAKECWKVVRYIIAFFLICPAEGESFSILGSFLWFLSGIIFLAITYQPSNK